MSTTSSVPAGNFLILDFEATCSEAGSTVTVPREEMEIIEIGALVVSGLTVISEFSSFVRPVRHPVLSDFCTNLTTITQGDVEAAKAFPQVAEEVAAWARALGVTWWGSWGQYDRTQLTRDVGFHGVTDPLPQPHRNIKEMFSVKRGTRPMGLNAAVSKVGLDFVGTPHRGIDDARNIARLLPYVLDAA